MKKRWKKAEKKKRWRLRRRRRLKTMSKWIMSIGCRRACDCAFKVYGSASGSRTAIGTIDIQLTCVVINSQWKRKCGKFASNASHVASFPLRTDSGAIPFIVLCHGNGIYFDKMQMRLWPSRCQFRHSVHNSRNLQIAFTCVWLRFTITHTTHFQF